MGLVLFYIYIYIYIYSLLFLNPQIWSMFFPGQGKIQGGRGKIWLGNPCRRLQPQPWLARGHIRAALYNNTLPSRTTADPGHRLSDMHACQVEFAQLLSSFTKYGIHPRDQERFMILLSNCT